MWGPHFKKSLEVIVRPDHLSKINKRQILILNGPPVKSNPPKFISHPPSPGWDYTTLDQK